MGDRLVNQNESAKPSSALAQCPLLLIDDNAENLKLLNRVLEWAGYTNICSTTSAKEGLELIPILHPDLVILDLLMPEMDGYEFLRSCQEGSALGGFLPILVFTADLSPEAKNRALELGASDFLTKPGDAIEIQLRVRNFLRMRNMHTELEDQNLILEAKVQQRSEHLVIAWKETVAVLANACEFRDDQTGQHARRVGELSSEIARILGQSSSFVESIRLVAPLHDIGKIAIPDPVLFKPGKLSEAEIKEMRRHVAIGANLLSEKTSPLLQMAREIAEFHHERWDGKGYEAGLAGNSIPLSARIVCVADAFDAMTNDRPYQKGRAHFKALEELRAEAGKQFDPDIVDAIHRVFEAEPLSAKKAA